MWHAVDVVRIDYGMLLTSNECHDSIQIIQTSKIKALDEHGHIYITKIKCMNLSTYLHMS